MTRAPVAGAAHFFTHANRRLVTDCRRQEISAAGFGCLNVFLRLQTRRTLLSSVDCSMRRLRVLRLSVRAGVRSLVDHERAGEAFEKRFVASATG